MLRIIKENNNNTKTNKQKSWENVFQNCTYDHTTCKCAGEIGK